MQGKVAWGLAAMLVAAGAAQAASVAVRAGHLIDPATGQVEQDRVIRIEDGRITAVGGPATADEVIDLSDRWVMPGLMDAHVLPRDTRRCYQEMIEHQHWSANVMIHG